MKKAFLFLTMATFVTACAPEEILAPDAVIDQRSVQIVNNRDSPIVLFYGTVVANGRWGYDKLGNSMIFPGKALTLSFVDSRLCTYDLQAVFDDGEKIENRAVNICKISQWVVN